MVQRRWKSAIFFSVALFEADFTYFSKVLVV